MRGLSRNLHLGIGSGKVKGGRSIGLVDVDLERQLCAVIEPVLCLESLAAGSLVDMLQQFAHSTFRRGHYGVHVKVDSFDRMLLNKTEDESDAAMTRGDLCV